MVADEDQRDHHDHMDRVVSLVVVAVLFLAGSFSAVWIGRLKRPTVRMAMLLGLFALPSLFFSLVLRFAQQPAKGGFWLWWSIGMIEMVVPTLIWTGVCTGVYLFSRRAMKTA